jgi:ketosteroid isomerase-like protein
MGSMKLLRIAAALCGAALLVTAAASAQNLSLRAPPWALPLVGADITPTTGGRATLGGEGVDLAVRVTIAPADGGVARVIRYEARGGDLKLYLRRFTGHPSTGWWLWGSDGPRITTVPTAQGAEIATLARSVMGVAGALGSNATGDACAHGEQVFMEVDLGGRATTFSRGCAATSDAAGRLALRLSEIAGSRNDEEFRAAALGELLDADRAFAAKAAADGVPAAFAAYAADDALMLSSGDITRGHDGVVSAFANWPAGRTIEWAPEAGRVSERGDMGWTWGNATFVAPDGTRTTGRYISIWTRDLEGNWRYAVDAGVK